jgi:HlyD family secretion protein
MKLSQVLAGILLLAIGFVGGWWLSRDKTPAARTPSPAQTPLEQTKVVAQGRILPKDGLIHVFAPNQRIDEILVKEGQFVTMGTELATFIGQSTLDLQTELVKSQGNDAQRELEQKILAAEGNLLSANGNLNVAQLQLQQLEADDSIMVAEKQLESAREKWRRMSQLATDPATRLYVAQTNLEDQQLAIEQAELQLKTARQKRVSSTEAAKLNLEVAQKAQTQAESVLNSLRDLQRENRTRELSQSIAQTTANNAKLLAPSDATVLKINGKRGEVMLQSPLMQLGNLSELVCIAEVVDRLAIDVQPQQLVTMTSPALAQPIRGTVRSVSRMVGTGLLIDPNPLAVTDRRTVEVIIAIDPADREVAETLINLQVNVEIQVTSQATARATESGHEALELTER